jgi:predicted RNA-binding protein with RPS1 domain
MGEATASSVQIQDIKRKTHFSGKVVKTSLAGAIVDVGLDKPGMVHISQLKKGQVNRVEDVVKVGDDIDVWVRQVNKKTGHLDLTMIEPVGLDWGEIKSGMVIKGEVVKIEKFGAFIEIGAERPGLAHISELTHDYIREVGDAVKVGDEVEVQVLEIDRKKKQIKLSLKALQKDPSKVEIEEAQEEEEEEEEVIVPTAMELALKKAMDETKKGKKPKTEVESSEEESDIAVQEREAILERTLKNKVRTE